ncbi:uncharacterized protein LOC123662623 [Melitaea cinxia]|uniref:uncharacterized protein LOC123662623 n=1 Tax=Melitaea cinxia TaxID=113334 RepID=UPI001E271FE4|nr:uncharacterized protein LOC123662623 [Melitaea cinxia]
MFIHVFMSFCLLSNAFADTSGVESTTTSGCGDVGDCIDTQKCEDKCGCDSSAAVLFYNETLGECVVNVKELLRSLTKKYNNEEKIEKEVHKVFQGILFAAILFASCAALCVFSACIYCCRINYMDTRLKNDVDALALKMKRDFRLKRCSTKKPRDPASESCNIIVEGAGVYVV